MDLDEKYMKEAIRQAKKCVEGNMIEEIAHTVAEMKKEDA